MAGISLIPAPGAGGGGGGGASEPLGRLALTNDWSTAATVPGAGTLAVYADFLNTVDINADGADGGDWVTVTEGAGDGGGSPVFVLAEGVYTIGLEVEQASNTGGTGSWSATLAHVAGPDLNETRVPVTSAHLNSLSQSWEQDEVTIYVPEGTGFVPVIHNGDAAATDFDWVGIWITKWS